MKFREVQQRAKSVGVRCVGVKRPDMIRAIQQAEGNLPCFARSNGGCSQTGCCWRADCVKP